MFFGGLTIAINGFSMVFVYQGVTRQILTVAGGTFGTALLWYIKSLDGLFAKRNGWH